jgi:4-aminobutyrate aminotransferase-like enzyme
MHVPYPDPYRPWFGSNPESESSKNLAFLERLMDSVVSPQMIAGIILEPILSMGGNIVPPDGYFERLAELCREHDIPLIADEVLTGIGKTGRMFAMEHWNVCPDAMCLGKALSASLPLSLLVAREELAEKWEPKDHVPMGKDGHVLGCAAALAVLRAAREERLADKAEKMGEYLSKRLQNLKEDWGLQGQIRGLGLMIGFDLVESDETKLPASDLAEKIVQGALRRGLILGTVGVKGNVIRFMPALVVEREQVDRAVEILDQTLVELEVKVSN